MLEHCRADGERGKRKLTGGVPRQRPAERGGEARMRGPAWTVDEWAGGSNSVVFLFLFIPKVIYV